MTTPAGSHTGGDTTGSGSAATEHKSFQGAREVEELKASDLEWLEARRINADHHWPKTDDVLDWVAGENAKLDRILALARRSLPSPEAGGCTHEWRSRVAARPYCIRCRLVLGTKGELFRDPCEEAIEIATSAAAPEAGGVIAEAREAAVLLRAADADLEAKGFKLAYGYGAECRDAVCSAEAVLDRFADLAERQVAEIEGLKAPKRKSCSCMDVYGEDPNCFKHGSGTEWSKANPDICKLAGDLTEARSDLSRLRDTAETLVAELVTLCRAWMYAPFPAEAQVCGAKSPPSGPLAVAADAVKAARTQLHPLLNPTKGAGA